MSTSVLSIDNIFKEIMNTEFDECKTTLYEFYINEYIKRKRTMEVLDEECINFMRKRDKIAEEIYSLVPRNLMSKPRYQSISEYIRGVISYIEETKLVDQKLINQLRYHEQKVIEYNNLSEKEMEKIKRLSYNPFIIILSQLNGDIEKFLDIVGYFISKFFLDTFTNNISYDSFIDSSRGITMPSTQETHPFIEHVVSKINKEFLERIHPYLDRRLYDYNWKVGLSGIEELLISNINEYMRNHDKYESIIKKKVVL